ncbi:MAG: DUF4468 domain-containing protein [Bacteroidota bacterium]
MRSKSIAFLLFFLPILLIGQTDELEKQYLYEYIKEKNLTPVGKKRITENWYETLEELGGYPHVPYNPGNEEIEYERVIGFSGIEKTYIFKKVKEWIAINYGNLKEVVHYEDYESGKIIAQANIVINDEVVLSSFMGNPKNCVETITCYHTVVFSIIEEKMKMQAMNITFYAETESRIRDGVFIPKETLHYTLNQVYPIANKDKSTWKSRLATLQRIGLEVDEMEEELSKYILSSKDEGF